MDAFFAASRSELARWMRSPARVALLLAPFLATGVCLGVYSNRVARNLPVAVVDLDHSGLSRSLVRSIGAVPQISAIELSSEGDGKSALARGEVRAVAILPDGLDRAVRQGATGRVQFLRDASNPMAANQLYSAMSSLVAAEGARLEAGRLAAAGLNLSQAKEMALVLRSDPRGMANPGLDYLANFAPGLFPMFLQMGLMLAAGSMLSGPFRSRSDLVEFLGRSFPWVAVQGSLALAYYLVFLPGLGGPHAPAIPTVGLLCLLMTVSVLFGGVVGRFSRSGIQAMQTLLAFNTPAFPLSGYTFPEWAMPALLRLATRPLPFSLFVDAYRGFSGWSSDRAWIGFGGLVVWAAGSFAFLLVPSRAPVSEPVPAPRSRWTGALGLEMSHVVSTSGLSLMFFAAPVGYLALYGAMYALKEERQIPVAVVHAQGSGPAREITRALEAHPSLSAYPVSGETEARQALRDGRVRAVVELPADLDVRLRRREATAIPLVYSADRFLPASDIQRAVSEVLLWRGLQERIQVFQGRGVPPLLAKGRAEALVLDDRPLANPRETYGDFMLPPLGILVLHQLCLVAIAFSTATQASVRSLGRLAARMVVFVGWFGLWSVLWVVGALRLFDVPVAAHPGPLFALGTLGLVGAGSIGMALGFVLRDAKSVLQLAAFSSYPFFFASGASWPKEAFPRLVELGSKVLPLTPWLAGANRALRLGAGFAEVRGELLHAAVLVVCWFAAVVVLSRILDRPEDVADVGQV